MHGLQAQDVEPLLQDQSSGLAEKDSAHVDLLNLVRPSLLLYAIAVIIKLRECSTQVIEVVTEDVRAEVFKNTADHLGESDDGLCQFKLLLMIQGNNSCPGSFCYLLWS